MALSLILSSTLFLTDALYLHGFAFLKTFELLFKYNSPNDSDFD